MSSRKLEEGHVMRIKDLLMRSGLECERPAPESVEFTSSSESVGKEESEEEEIKEESIQEHTEAIEEQKEESIPSQHNIFPTPSLRRILPEHIRNIEEFNRIHVLPEKFNTNIDPEAIPIIAKTPLKTVIDILADITGCTAYKRSYAEFWFLDTLANLLRRAQEDQMEKFSQAVLMAWFCEWMKEMQFFDAADRQRMIRRFQDNITSAAKFVAQYHRLPTPKEVGVSYEAEDGETLMGPDLVKFGTGYQCAMTDLTYIAHYIYDLFSTDYQYDLVRSVFTSTPEYNWVDAPDQMRIPKTLLTPKDKTNKMTKKEKPKKKDVKTEEFSALLKGRAREERDLEEQESKDREEWNRRSHILPLSYAADDEVFNKYWPLEQSNLDLKRKGQGKKQNKR